MQYYIVNVTWTSKTDSEIVSTFIVESLSVKDAINRVLSKHSFHLLEERIKVSGIEIGLNMRLQQNCVLAVGNTVQNG